MRPEKESLCQDSDMNPTHFPDMQTSDQAEKTIRGLFCSIHWFSGSMLCKLTWYAEQNRILFRKFERVWKRVEQQRNRLHRLLGLSGKIVQGDR